MVSGTTNPPAELQEFLAALAKLVPGLRLRIEPGGEKLGNWWVDIEGKDCVTVEWRRTLGFGVFAGADYSYGEGPAEIFRTPSRAAHRVSQLISPTLRSSATGLRALRELYGITQEQIAAKLHQRQAAISRLESRTDSKIETISKFVHALGGQMEIRAVFPDGQMSIYPTTKPKAPRRSRKASRSK